MSSALIILAEGFEDLEAITITDLLVRADIDVTRAGLREGVVRASRHTQVVPDCALDEVMDVDFDLLVLPGGLPGADNLAADERVLTLARRQIQQNKFLGAICAAPRVLLKAGVHKGKSLTCFPGALDKLDTRACKLTNEAVCLDLPLITGRGPGTAIDFALSLIELLEGKKVRDSVWQSLAG